MKLSEVVAEVITLSTAIRKYWDGELPKRHPNYPVVSPGENDPPPPPEQQQLRNFLANLPEEELYKIALLMVLGRGDFGADDLPEHYDTLRKRFAKPEWLVAQLMGKVPLADYLTDGLAALKKSGIDVDHLAFAAVSSGS